MTAGSCSGYMTSTFAFLFVVPGDFPTELIFKKEPAFKVLLEKQWNYLRWPNSILSAMNMLSRKPFAYIISCVSALSVSEKLVYCFRFLAQQTLHASVCFASCNHPDPSVLVAGKSRSRTEILANTGTHLGKPSFWRAMELILPPSLLYYTRPETSITAASPGMAS